MLLNEYVPVFLREFKEYRELNESLDVEVKNLYDNLALLIKESSIMNASERRISEWEAFLRISPKGNLYQRKLYITATLRGQGKLSEGKIKDIVNAYTEGGGANVSIVNSVLVVEIKPPNQGEIFLFTDIERTLKDLKPAHLGLIVKRFYSTIARLENEFSTILDIENNLATIKDLENWIGE